MRDHEYFVYIMASRSGTLYIGVTNSIYRRALRQQVSVRAIGLLRKLRRCAPSDWKREGIERLAEGQEDRSDRIEESEVARFR